MPTARNNYAAATMNGKIYVAGGMMTDMVNDTVECYDPIDDVWTTKKSMVHKREKFSLFESYGKLYAIGSIDSIEQYDSDKDKWTVVRKNKSRKNAIRGFSFSLILPDWTAEWQQVH